MSSGLPASSVTPVHLDLQSAARRVSVTWDDGHESHYSFGYLRGYCPCAVCQGHSGGWDFVDNVSCELEDVLEVGHYALNFVWAKDGGDQAHRTGIVPFETLRILCPCATCLELQGPGHPAARLTPEQKALVLSQEDSS